MGVTLHSWRLYLVIYSLLLIPALRFLTLAQGQHPRHIKLAAIQNSDKLRIVFMLISLGGLPPFLGFFNKLLIVKILLSLGIIILGIIIFRSLTLLYYYLSSFFFTNP